MYDPGSDTAPVRRRIIPQPLRTEAPCALIAGDSLLTGELEACLKRAHPLISFPSLSHFLAEPPRREPWEAIVVARSGAWDPRLDAYVRKRGRIALFGLTEESFGWPQTVARVRDLSELEPWLAALNAPEPVHKERIKRTKRAPAQMALSGLAPSWAAHGSRPPEPTPAASAPAQDPQPTEAALAQPAAPPPASSVRPQPVEMAAPRDDRKARTARPPKERAASRPAPRAQPAGRPRPAATTGQTRPGSPAELEFTRLALEVGISRAVELLDKLRKRAAHLVSTLRND